MIRKFKITDYEHDSGYPVEVFITAEVQQHENDGTQYDVGQMLDDVIAAADFQMSVEEI